MVEKTISNGDNSSKFDKKAEGFFTKNILIIILLLIGLLVILFVINISTEIKLAIIAIGITIFFALTQNEHLKNQKNQLRNQEILLNNQENQLKKLEDIGEQTKDTTEKLKTDSIIRENVNKFLGNTNKGKNNQQKYKCLFPVEYNSRPLPFINQGDFYAIHVLSTYIGEDNIDLHGVTKDDESIDSDLLKGNVFFICAPSGNLALRKVLEFKELRNDAEVEHLKKWPLEGLNLPCWFVVDHRKREFQQSIKKIKIYDESIEKLLISDCEDIYINACGLPRGKKFEGHSNIQPDYGIFARLKTDSYQYIIIGGLHAQGTWIVASLLSNLLSGKNIDYKSTFLGSEDFIAVIYGEFDAERLAVNSESILVYNKYIWTKENDKWIRKASNS